MPNFHFSWRTKSGGNSKVTYALNSAINAASLEHAAQQLGCTIKERVSDKTAVLSDDQGELKRQFKEHYVLQTNPEGDFCLTQFA